MKPTDSISEAVGEVYGYSKAYFQQQLEYFKLDMAERVSRSLSLAITIFVLALPKGIPRGKWGLCSAHFVLADFPQDPHYQSYTEPDY